MGKPSAKPSGLKGDAASDAILHYLKKQNRPYSAVDLFNNLKGEVGKSNVQKILQQMVDDGMIHGKQYGKQWVFVAKQDELPSLSQEELDSLDKEAERLQEENRELKGIVKQLESTSDGLSSQLTDEQLAARIEEITKEKRLEGLREGGAQMSEKDKQRINNLYDKGRKAWATRKKMFKNIWDNFTEHLPKKPAEYMEELGIETDEMVGADFAKDQFA